MSRLLFVIALLCCAIFAAAAPAHAQFIRGKVVDAASGAPLANVSLELLGERGQRLGATLSDSAGEFRMQAALTGTFSLRAERIGLQPVTAPLSVEASERVEITVRMSAAALPMEPVTVDARSAVNIGSLAGYYARAERAQRLGMGTIITRDRIEERPVGAVSDLLREVTGVSVVSSRYGSSEVRFSGGARVGCTPQVYLDGVVANRSGPAIVNELVHPSELEGIEIYRGNAAMGEYYDISGCGVMLLWTRRTVDGSQPFTWRRLLTFGALLGLILIIAR